MDSTGRNKRDNQGMSNTGMNQIPLGTNGQSIFGALYQASDCALALQVNGILSWYADAVCSFCLKLAQRAIVIVC